jgi:hypothetical protein
MTRIVVGVTRTSLFLRALVCAFGWVRAIGCLGVRA